MPIVTGTYLTTRKANTVMAAAFGPRAKEWVFPKLCGSYITTSLTEPHAIGGAAPPLKRWNGSMLSTGLPSWTLEIPNPVHKNILDIRRGEIEGDQTRTLIKKVDEIGVALADYPEQLWAARLLKAGLTASATDTFEGKSYNVTMDGLPFFGTAHQLDGVTSQSNEIQGQLPATVAGIQAQDLATSAQQMQRDLAVVVNKIKTVKNNQNLPIFPTLDTGKSIVCVVPSALEVVARVAFETRGTVGGSGGNSGSSGSTSNEVVPKLVKDVIVSGYLDGLPDPEAQTYSALTPAHPTSYYFFVVTDRVKPFYWQLFKPAGPNDLFPEGYNVDNVINGMIKEAETMGLKITREQATLFASTIVEHNLGQVGANASRDIVERETFFMSARFRGNVVYGPWFCGWRVDPSGTSGG